MASCAYCQALISAGPPWAPGRGYRLAYDPGLGRLWAVCSECSRWNLTPLEQRWESLEACEEAVRTRGTVLLSTPQLSLIDLSDGELVRIGEPLRPDFVEWRYGEGLPAQQPKPGFWARMFSGLPPPPMGGYDPYRGIVNPVNSAPWFASPFLEAASALTYLFSQVPLAPACPSCHHPMPLRPWEFQSIQLLSLKQGPGLLASCALCHDEVTIPLREARPALRLSLGIVTDPTTVRDLARSAAEELGAAGGPSRLVESLSRDRFTLGEMNPLIRVGLLVSLDELADTEALEAEWRRAEEVAAIMDGELSHVPGFEEFRRGILEPDL